MIYELILKLKMICEIILKLWFNKTNSWKHPLIFYRAQNQHYSQLCNFEVLWNLHMQDVITT